MDRWEYRYVEALRDKDIDVLERELNQLGAEGWELAINDISLDGTCGFIMKRVRE